MGSTDAGIGALDDNSVRPVGGGVTREEGLNEAEDSGMSGLSYEYLR